MDALTDILRQLRLKGTVYFRHRFARPWGMRVGAGPCAQFHILVRGHAIWRSHAGVAIEAHELSSGDVLVFPRGAGHDLMSDSTAPLSDGREVVTAIVNGTRQFDGHEVSAELICGHFEYAGSESHPLLTSLPDSIHVAATMAERPGSALSLASLLADELGGEAPGDELVRERLAEALFVQVIRAYVQERRPETGFLAALHDPRIGRALSHIHGSLDTPSTLAGLAEVAGMSRSTFADRFRLLVGATPMAYAEYWRLSQARERIEATNEPLSRIADAVGYRSQASFHRAFKRRFGISPGRLRRSQAAPPG